MYPTNHSKTVRATLMAFTAFTLLLLALAGAGWGGIARAQTIPTTTTITTGNLQTQIVDAPLSFTDPAGNQVGTAQIVTLPGQTIGDVLGVNEDGANVSVGSATSQVIPPADLPPAPAGTTLLTSGLQLQLFDPAGIPIVFLSRPIRICLVPPAGAAGFANVTLRRFDATLIPPRWVTFPTFTFGGMICTNTRLPGTFALFGS